MHIRNLSQKFDIAYVVKDQWHLPVHKHTHYEIQYIIRGSGRHMINEQSYNYEKGDLFIVPPQDNHFFIFEERTAICVIKFHEDFFESLLHDADFRQLLSGFSAPGRKVMLSSECRNHIAQLMELIMSERKKESVRQGIIMKNALGLILALISEEEQGFSVNLKEGKIQAVFNYIHQHITEKPLLSIENIARQFNISKTYFNQYFTRATGSPYKKYVQLYALNLVAHRLMLQDKTISQLAGEFGYSDESNLGKVM